MDEPGAGAGDSFVIVEWRGRKKRKMVGMSDIAKYGVFIKKAKKWFDVPPSVHVHLEYSMDEEKFEICSTGDLKDALTGMSDKKTRFTLRQTSHENDELFHERLRQDEEPDESSRLHRESSREKDSADDVEKTTIEKAHIEIS
mmetsp:Transcript_17690/g.43218  ORF Transcript_17690/g.43218 Transcript_17690/m.43218 type:complete len:143 (-) Transcript_17690:100-528(-)